jgi:hypothetical protein
MIFWKNRELFNSFGSLGIVRFQVKNKQKFDEKYKFIKKFWLIKVKDQIS